MARKFSVSRSRVKKVMSVRHIQTREFIQPLQVTAGKLFNSKFGSYRHDDLIGLPYGSKVASSHGRGFIHVLRPTPELWTMALPHRTQILYLADIAFVTSWLNIKPGSNVIEAGRVTTFLSFSDPIVFDQSVERHSAQRKPDVRQKGMYNKRIFFETGRIPAAGPIRLRSRR